MIAIIFAFLLPTYNQPFDELCYGGMGKVEMHRLAVSLMCMEQDQNVVDYTVYVASL